MEQSYIKEEQKILLYKALSKIRAEYSQDLYLKFFEYLSNEQIAVIMKKRKLQIENLIYQAKLSLKSELDKEDMTGIACCCLIAVLGISVMRGNQVAPATPDSFNPTVQSDTMKKPVESLPDRQIQQENSVWLSADEISKTGNNVYMGCMYPLFFLGKVDFTVALNSRRMTFLRPRERKYGSIPSTDMQSIRSISCRC